MNNEDAATEVCKILERVQDSQRLKVLEMIKQDFCFFCGARTDGKGCDCWNAK